MRKQILKEIEDILCKYYEGATNGTVCDEEIQRLMSNSAWADIILYRIMVTLFPDNTEDRSFWDPNTNKEFIVTVNTRPEWVSELIKEKIK